MERLRFCARLAKATHLPFLVTGGAPDRVDKKLPEAILMSHVFHDELGIKTKWIESNSNATQENARMLKKSRVQVIYLVTHFWHIPRAKVILRKKDFR